MGPEFGLRTKPKVFIVSKRSIVWKNKVWRNKMSNVARNLIALVAMVGMVMGTVMADDDSGIDGGEPAMAMLMAHVTGDILTIENTGTAPSVDFGGAQVVVGNERVGLLPYTNVMQPNPFTFTKFVNAPVGWSKNIKLTRPLAAGEKFVITNGVGIYVKGVAA